MNGAVRRLISVGFRDTPTAQRSYGESTSLVSGAHAFPRGWPYEGYQDGMRSIKLPAAGSSCFASPAAWSGTTCPFTVRCARPRCDYALLEVPDELGVTVRKSDGAASHSPLSRAPVLTQKSTLPTSGLCARRSVLSAFQHGTRREPPSFGPGRVLLASACPASRSPGGTRGRS